MLKKGSLKGSFIQMLPMDHYMITKAQKPYHDDIKTDRIKKYLNIFEYLIF